MEVSIYPTLGGGGVPPVVIPTETTTGGEKGAREADEGTCTGWRNDPRWDQHANNSQEHNVHRFKTKKCQVFFCTWNKRLFAMKLLMDEIRQTNWYGRCSVNYSALTHSNCCRSVSSNYTCAVRTHKKRNPGFCVRQTIKTAFSSRECMNLLAILQPAIFNNFQPDSRFCYVRQIAGNGIISAASMEVMRRWT